MTGLTTSNDAKKDPMAGLRIGTSQEVPRWVPVTLLALSSAALLAPIVMLRRYRRGIISQNLRDVHAPPRRGCETSVTALHFPPPGPTRSHPTSQTRLIQSHPLPLTGLVSNKVTDDDHFNAPLYTLKAFGIATVLVAFGATASILGVMRTFNAHDIGEFADRMRNAVTTKLPVLSYRIYRPTEPDPVGDLHPHVKNSGLEPMVQWNWQEAENRLKEVFDKDGFYSWASAALKEVEAEARAERARRGIREDISNGE